MTKKSAAKRREWIRQHMAEPISSGQLITNYAAAFSIRDEAKAAEEVKAILAADREIDEDMGDSAWTRHIALGEKLMADMLEAKAHGPAAQMWKAISQVKGFEKAQKLEVEVSAGPNVDLVRERIAKLMQDQRVKEQAQAIDVDLDAMASESTANPIDAGDKFSPAGLLARTRAGGAETAPADPAPAPSTDAGPPNIVAEYVAAVLPKDR